jgi:ABC-type multidrug transport system permease subunit
MLFAFAVCWIAALVGILAKGAASVQGMAFALIFPLTFASNVFVPTAELPDWLQAWVKINPVTRGEVELVPPRKLGRWRQRSLIFTSGLPIR